MSADSPRRGMDSRCGGHTIPCVVPPQIVSDRSILDSAIGFINDVTLSAHQPHNDPKNTITWARFESMADISNPRFGDDWELEGNVAPPLLLVLGYGLGVQVWAIPANGEAIEVLSWRHGSVSTLRVLPTPLVCHEDAEHRADELTDHFAEKRPLLALCDGGGNKLAGNAQPQFCAVNFVSLKTGAQVKTIKFKNTVLDILANHTSIVITFNERIAVFDARTLEDRLSITSCFPSPGVNPNPVALGSRWLAYAENKLIQCKRSGGGCDGEAVASYTATVLNAAKSFGKGLRELGEQVAAGLTGASSSGNSGNNSKNSSFDSNSSGDVRQPGVVTIMDIKYPVNDFSPTSGTPLASSGSDPFVAHFVAHSEAVVGMEFDNSGMLLLTADKRGHDFHVFRIQPHPVGSGLAAVHHLYVLHRGDTSAKVQNIAFSLDSRWVAVSTLRGTTHVFPITPYGGPMGVRTHTSLHVVNKLSRFHRSAGLSVEGRSNSPISHSDSTTFSQSLMPYHNPTLPPYPRPIVVLPLAQLRQPFVLGSPPGSAASLSKSSASATPGNVCSQRQRLSSLSDDNGKPLSVCSIFAKSRSWLLDPPNATWEAPHRMQRKAIDSLFVMAGHGALIQYDLDTRLALNVAKEKICDDTPIELEVEAKAQWNLGRKESSQEIMPPLSSDNWLIKDRSSCMLTDSSRHFDEADDRADSWLSQVEIITHAGPHRRLWMGPQFVFKTYNSPSGSNLSHIESESIEIGIAAATCAAAARAERSSPLNMPLSATGRASVPILIESGSYSSIEQSPKLMDRFHHDHLNSDFAVAHGDTRLKEDLADAMRESPSVPKTVGEHLLTDFTITNEKVPFSVSYADHIHVENAKNTCLSSQSTVANAVPNMYSYGTHTTGTGTHTTTTPIEKVVNPLGTVTTIITGIPTESSKDILDEVVSQLASEEAVIHENCDESLFRPVVAIFCDEVKSADQVEKDELHQELCKPPEVIVNKLIVPVIEKELDEELAKIEKLKFESAKGKKYKKGITKNLERENYDKIQNKERLSNFAELIENRDVEMKPKAPQNVALTEKPSVSEQKLSEFVKSHENMKDSAPASTVLSKNLIKNPAEKSVKKPKNVLENVPEKKAKTNKGGDIKKQKDKKFESGTTKEIKINEPESQTFMDQPKDKPNNTHRHGENYTTAEQETKRTVESKKTGSQKEIDKKVVKKNQGFNQPNDNITVTSEDNKALITSDGEIKRSELDSKRRVAEINPEDKKPTKLFPLEQGNDPVCGIQQIEIKECEKENTECLDVIDGRGENPSKAKGIDESMKETDAGEIKQNRTKINANQKNSKIEEIVNKTSEELNTEHNAEEKAVEVLVHKNSTPKITKLEEKIQTKLQTDKNPKSGSKIKKDEESVRQSQHNKTTNVQTKLKTSSLELKDRTEEAVKGEIETGKSGKQTELESAIDISVNIKNKKGHGGNVSDPVGREVQNNMVDGPLEKDSVDAATRPGHENDTKNASKDMTTTIDDQTKENVKTSKESLKEAFGFSSKERESNLATKMEKTSDKEESMETGEGIETMLVDTNIQNKSTNVEGKCRKLNENKSTKSQRGKLASFISEDIEVSTRPTQGEREDKVTEKFKIAESGEVKESELYLKPLKKLSEIDQKSESLSQQEKGHLKEGDDNKTKHHKKFKKTMKQSEVKKEIETKKSGNKMQGSTKTDEVHLDRTIADIKRSCEIISSDPKTSESSITKQDVCLVDETDLWEKSKNEEKLEQIKGKRSPNLVKELNSKKKNKIVILDETDFETKQNNSIKIDNEIQDETLKVIKKTSPEQKNTLIQIKPSVSSKKVSVWQTLSGADMINQQLNKPERVKERGSEIVSDVCSSQSKAVVKDELKLDSTGDSSVLNPLDTLPPLPSLEPLNIIESPTISYNSKDAEINTKDSSPTSLINFESPQEISPTLESKITPPPSGFTEKNLILALCGSLHYENESDHSRSTSANTRKSTMDYKSIIENINDEQYLSLEQTSNNTTPRGKSSSTSANSSVYEEVNVDNIKNTKEERSKRQESKQNEALTKKSKSIHDEDADEDKEYEDSDGCINSDNNNIDNDDDDDELQPLISLSETHIDSDSGPINTRPQTTEIYKGTSRRKDGGSITTDSEGPMAATTTSDDNNYHSHRMGTMSPGTNSGAKIKTKKLEHKINLIAAIEAATSSSSTSSAEESGVEGGNGEGVIGCVGNSVGGITVSTDSTVVTMATSNIATPVMSNIQYPPMIIQHGASKKKIKRRKR